MKYLHIISVISETYFIYRLDFHCYRKPESLNILFSNIQLNLPLLLFLRNCCILSTLYLVKVNHSIKYLPNEKLSTGINLNMFTLTFKWL